MDEGEVPNFKSPEEESLYWKRKALELKEKVDELEQDLIDFQDSSSQIEKELEKSLEHSERANMDLRTKCNRLTLELDLCREKFEQHCLQSSKQMSDSQKEVSDLKKNEEKLMKHIRDLEQKNDDLERSERVMIESVGNIEAKLNCVIERNALLESELDEKEMLKAMIQRLKDEQRDMQEELNRHKRHVMPDNEKYREYARTSIDSNKLSLESQSTPPTKSKNEKSCERIPYSSSVSVGKDRLIVNNEEYKKTEVGFDFPGGRSSFSSKIVEKSAFDVSYSCGLRSVGDDGKKISVRKPNFNEEARNNCGKTKIKQEKRGKENILKSILVNPSVGQLSPPNRISAINLVGDLLKKVGLEKWLCPDCSRVKCNCGVFEALSVTPTTTVHNTNTMSKSLSTART